MARSFFHLCVRMCEHVSKRCVCTSCILYPLIRRCSSDVTAHYDLYMRRSNSTSQPHLPHFFFSFLKKRERFGGSDSGSVLICFLIHNQSGGAFLSLCFICGGSASCVASGPLLVTVFFCFSYLRKDFVTSLLSPVSFHAVTVSLLCQSGRLHLCFSNVWL